METLSWILRGVGVVVYLFGWFPAVREMFAESRGLGYFGFFMPAVPLIFGLLHWEELKVQVILMGVGAAAVGGGIALKP